MMAGFFTPDVVLTLRLRLVRRICSGPVHCGRPWLASTSRCQKRLINAQALGAVIGHAVTLVENGYPVLCVRTQIHLVDRIINKWFRQQPAASNKFLSASESRSDRKDSVPDGALV